MSKTKQANNSIIFNEVVKNEFLDEQVKNHVITEETKVSYNRIFLKTYAKEDEYNKDLYDFNFEQFEEVLLSFESNTRNTVESYARIVSSYLNWCVKKGLTKDNLLATLKPKDFEKYIVNEEEYITDVQLRRYEDQCENYQDSVILRLLFMGVGGRKLSEIRNLKREDVDFENNRLFLMSTLKEDKEGRPVEFDDRYLDVDDRTMKMIQGAIDQKTYQKKNGAMEQTAMQNVRPYTDLVQNNYVLRSSITRTERYDCPVDKFLVYRRIQVIADFLGVENLQAKIIQRSGMLFRAEKYIKDEEFTLNALKMVAGKFGVKSHHNLKGFLTLENIRSVYPKEEGMS